MKQGRCIEINTGFFGCQVDAKQILEAQCSGRHACSLRVDDDALSNTKPCSRGILIYLDAAHACVKGEYSEVLLLE